MPTTPRNPASHHYVQAEETLATLGALGLADAGEQAVEVLAALTHAVLSIAATLALPAADPRSDEQRFGQDFH